MLYVCIVVLFSLTRSVLAFALLVQEVAIVRRIDTLFPALSFIVAAVVSVTPVEEAEPEAAMVLSRL
jgi:hypothetical protein